MLYTKLIGSGRPVLLIAGVASDHLSWQLQTVEFQQQYQVALLDNRGVGQSSLTEFPLTIESMTQDVVEVMQLHNLEKVSVVAHSMGSAIAQTLARKHPEKVERMVLASPFTHIDLTGLRVLEGWVRALEHGVDADCFGRLIFPWLFSRDFLSKPGCFELCVEGFRSHPHPFTAEGLKQQVDALAKFNSQDWLGDIQTECLLLAGGEDQLIPLELVREMSEIMPNSRLQVLDGAGHSGLVDSSQQFNRAVLRFLS